MAKTNGNLKVAVPTFIPLADAARKYNISENVLTRLIRDGRIEAAQLPSGELLVSDESLNGKTKEQIIKEKFQYLQGIGITISQAATKYDVPRSTLEAWVSRYGYIGIVDGHSYPKTINEAEVAYCAEEYHTRKAKGISSGGVPLLDEHGLPIYELKHPELAEYRRRKRRTGNS
jgi:hypothetical protein